MIVKSDLSVNELNSIYNDVTMSLNEKVEESVIFSHYGVFSQDLVNSIACTIEQLTHSSNETKTVVKRMFSVLIEGLQNIRLHCLNINNDLALGFVIVSKNSDRYKICFGNTIELDKQNKIKDVIDGLNNLDESELKERYYQLLSNGLFSNKGGAGLGFITMKMKSDDKINYKFHNIDDKYSVFSFCLNIKR